MMKKWLNTFRRKIFIVIGVLAILILLVLFFGMRINVDVGMILIGIAAIGLVYIIYLVIDHKIKPQKTVTVISKIKLTAPPRILNSIITYKLTINVQHHIEDKGNSRMINVDEIKLTFNKKDHPDIYNYCLQLIQKENRKNYALAESMYPHAEVVKGNIELPAELVTYQTKNRNF